LVVIIGSALITLKKPITILVVVGAIIFIVAQSSWTSAYIYGDVWGRDWANYVWFLFNTITMVVYSWTLIKLR